MQFHSLVTFVIPFYDKVKINKCTLVYKSLHDQALQYIKNLFKTNNEINGRQTGHAEYNLVCPKYNYATEPEGQQH